MTQNERFVFDTNVLVSALLFSESKPAQAFFLALQKGTLLTLIAALHELNDVLQRKKFEKNSSISGKISSTPRWTAARRSAIGSAAAHPQASSTAT
jgi:predicted nucleic acid-binding protein